MAHRDEPDDRFAAARNRLLDFVLKPTGRRPVRDGRVVEAMRRVPREEFVPPDLVADAYLNIALPIGEGQTISQPLIVEQMTAALHVGAGDRVLEIGTGSGYQAAILALLADEVITVERIPRLADEAGARLARLGYKNVRVMLAIEHLGWPREAPYDGIMVTAGAPDLPLELLDQLAVGRVMIVPAGPIGRQELLVATKTKSGHEVENLGACAFVPLVGAGAWPSDAD